MMEENSIFVKDLCKKFSGFTLDHVSFCVPRGRIVGFIGENGAGKSTTINLVLNELKKDGGKIEVFGTDHTVCSVKEKIGVVFDECSFHDIFTADNIGKILSGVYKSWDSSLYHTYLNRFRLPKDQPIGAFSKGMKMKLSIICALAHTPELLILDEATTGLDPVVRDEILDLFLEFIQDETHSIFFSSHITSDIQKIADYVVLIHQGKIIFEEQKDDLVYHYGIAKCGKETFAALSPKDYIIHRETNVCTECLVRDKEAVKRKYKDIIVVIAAGFSVAAGKYLSVICALGISLLGSLVLNLISAVIYRTFDASVWGFAAFLAVLIPLLWTGICLPMTYWFGVQSAQTLGLFVIIPVFYLVKYFEDGTGFSAMADSLSSYFVAAGIVTVVIFGISLFVSVIGYDRRK